MARTTSELVERVLGPNYDGSTSLTQFIDAASVMIDRVSTCAVKKGKTLSDAELELLERWVAAHKYQMMDPGYTHQATGGASGAYTGQFGKGLEGSRYGQAALEMDPSGCLWSLGMRARAGGFWMGTDRSLQE